VGTATSTFSKPSSSMQSNSKRDRSDSQIEQAQLVATMGGKAGAGANTTSVSSGGSEGVKSEVRGSMGRKGKLLPIVVPESGAETKTVSDPLTDSSNTTNSTANTTTTTTATTATAGMSKTDLPAQTIGKRQVSDASDVSALPFKKRRKPDASSSGSSSTSSDNDALLLAERELALAVGRIIDPPTTSTTTNTTNNKDTDSERDSTCSSRSSNLAETAPGEGCSSFLVENENTTSHVVEADKMDVVDAKVEQACTVDTELFNIVNKV